MCQFNAILVGDVLSVLVCFLHNNLLLFRLFIEASRYFLIFEVFLLFALFGIGGSGGGREDSGYLLIQLIEELVNLILLFLQLMKFQPE